VVYPFVFIVFYYISTCTEFFLKHSSRKEEVALYSEPPCIGPYMEYKHIFISYPTLNPYSPFKDQTFHVAWGNTCCLLWETDGTQEYSYILRGNAGLWNVECTAAFNNSWTLRVKNTWKI